MTARRRWWWLAAALLWALAACGGAPVPGDDPAAGPATSDPGPRRPPPLSEAWSWSSPGGFSPGVPATAGEHTAATWSHQLLVLLDATGAPRWDIRRLGLLEVAPAVTAALVVAATDDGLVAHDRASGRLAWEAGFGAKPGPPLATAERIAVSTWNGSLLVLDAGDGRVLWRAQLGGPSLGAVAVSGSLVLATFDTGSAAGVSAFELDTGRRRWTAPVPAGGVSAPAVSAGDTVVVVAGVAAHGLSIDDGTVRWRTPLDGSGAPELAPLALADGTVVVGHRLGGMAALDGRDGRLRWQSSSHGAAVRGGPAGPGPGGWFAMPLHDGTLLLAAPGRADSLHAGAGTVTGVGRGPHGTLLVSLGRGDDNHLLALRGW